MSNKKVYKELCNSEPSIPIFSRDWWLDAVAGESNWDVILLEKNGEIHAAFPFVKKKKWIFDIQNMPVLTQTLGPWIKYPQGQKYTNKLSFEKEIYTELIKNLPTSHFFNQNFHPTVSNWLPFYWNGFTQTTRYTYIIENLKNMDDIYSEFRSNIRREIRKAEKSVKIIESEDIESFYKINTLTFQRQGTNIPYSIDTIRKIDESCKVNNCRKMFFAVDKDNRIHSVLYLIWDQDYAYYLMGGSDPELRNNGSMSLLLWHAIQFSSNVTKAFNFEGSMIEPIERFVRGFGAKQQPYYNIYKYNSKLLLLRKYISELKN